MKQFIDLCNNLRAKYSTAATTAASPAASVSASASAAVSSSFSATASSSSSAQNLTTTAAAQTQQKQQILVQLPTGEGGATPAIRQISPTTAVKFLHARKFDVLRAVSLYEQHEQIRQKEHLYNIDPDVETLRSELQTGKFTILVSTIY